MKPRPYRARTPTKKMLKLAALSQAPLDDPDRRSGKDRRDKWTCRAMKIGWVVRGGMMGPTYDRRSGWCAAHFCDGLDGTDTERKK